MSTSPAACYLHPTRTAVEHCEKCQRPLCGSCLWYAESGERLCPDHATEALQAGQTVHPPERYAEGIPHSEVSAANPPQPELPYRGNSTDLTALLAVVIALAGLGSCMGLWWVFPLLGFVLGLVAWLQAKDAHDPQRTRMLAGAGLASGGVVFLLIACWVLMMAATCFLPLIFASTSGPTTVNTPVYYTSPTPYFSATATPEATPTLTGSPTPVP